MLEIDGGFFKEFSKNRERRVNWWNPPDKMLNSSLLFKRENSTSPNVLWEPRNPMNPSFLLTCGRCRFQLAWMNLEWEQHIKIAPDTRNRCLLYRRATGLFHQFNECFTLSKASSLSYKLQSDSGGSVTWTQRHKSQVWQKTNTILLCAST